MYLRGEEINPDEGKVTLWFFRLFGKTHYLPRGIELSNPEGSGVRHLLEKNKGIWRRGVELSDEIPDTPLDEVIAEKQQEGGIAEKILSSFDGVG